MKVSLWYIGKNKQDFIKEGVSFYQKKLGHYTKFELREFDKIKVGKNDSPEVHKKTEASYLLAKIPKEAYLILLDEKGKTYDSIGFSQFLEKQITNSPKEIIFLIGGAYGFDSSVYDRANAKISFSEMTLSHQLIRIVFLEQLYRAFTIIKGESYHNA